MFNENIKSDGTVVKNIALPFFGFSFVEFHLNSGMILTRQNSFFL